MKHQSILAALLLVGTPMAYAQSSFEDDIYYNPKKAKNTQTKKKESNYIADMSAMDVDTYNRRGEQYYLSPVDTIGTATENGEDFVYTQQIQKYYNPTIVVDNADVLGDVLANAYGNVEIVIDNNGLPVFTPYYGYPYWGSYGGWGLNVSPWGWSVGFYDPWYSWTWGPSWGWGPSWTWGPSWAWGPSWGWGPGWGPSWGWGPGWGPGHNPAPRPPMANWRPQGNRPTGPRPGWSTNTRPGGNYADGNHRVPGGMRPGAASRPGSSTSRPGNNTRPAGSHTGVVNNGGRWEYNTTGTTGHRKAGTGAVNTGRGTNTQGGSVNTNNGSTRRDRVGNTRNNTNNNRYNTNSNNSNRNSYNTGNRGTTRNNSGFNSGRSNSSNRGSMGGSRGGGRSTGGGGRGRR